MSTNPKATAADLKEAVHRQRAAKPEIVKQRKEGRGKQADGNVHAVTRVKAPSRTQEAADATNVEWPTAKRHVRASTLPAIEAPPGYSIRYVRRDDRARGDNANFLKALREGWVVARQGMFPQANLPTTRIASHGDVIGNDDSILMVCTIEMEADRIHTDRQRTAAATRGVHSDNNLRNVVTPQMPLVKEVMNSSPQFHRMRKRNAEPAGEVAEETDE